MRAYFRSARNRLHAGSGAGGGPTGGSSRESAKPRATGTQGGASPDKPPLKPVLIVGGIAVAWIGMICLGGVLAWVAMPADQSPVAAFGSGEPAHAVPPAPFSTVAELGPIIPYAPTPWVEVSQLAAAPHVSETRTALQMGPAPVADSAAPESPVVASDSALTEQTAEAGAPELAAEASEAETELAAAALPAAAAAAALAPRPQVDQRQARRDVPDNRRYAASRGGRERIYVRSAYSPPRTYWGGSAVRDCGRSSSSYQFDAERTSRATDYCR